MHCERVICEALKGRTQTSSVGVRSSTQTLIPFSHSTRHTHTHAHTQGKRSARRHSSRSTFVPLGPRTSALGPRATAHSYASHDASHRSHQQLARATPPLTRPSHILLRHQLPLAPWLAINSTREPLHPIHDASRALVAHPSRTALLFLSPRARLSSLFESVAVFASGFPPSEPPSSLPSYPRSPDGSPRLRDVAAMAEQAGSSHISTPPTLFPQNLPHLFLSLQLTQHTKQFRHTTHTVIISHHRRHARKYPVKSDSCSC